MVHHMAAFFHFHFLASFREVGKALPHLFFKFFTRTQSFIFVSSAVIRRHFARILSQKRRRGPLEKTVGSAKIWVRIGGHGHPAANTPGEVFREKRAVQWQTGIVLG